MRSMEWKRLIGKTLHGSICLWLVLSKSSVFCALRSTSFQILYCVLVRFTRTPRQTLHGKTDWCGLQVHRNTQTWTELTGGKGIRVEYLPRIQHLAAQWRSQMFTVEIRWDRHLGISQEESYLCRCSTTFPVDQETMKKMRVKCSTRFSKCKEFWIRTKVIAWSWFRESGIRSVQVVHKVNGTIWRKNDVRIWRKQTSSLPCHESIAKRSAQKQRRWKIVDTLLCRWGYDWHCCSQNDFCESAQSLRSSRRNVWRMRNSPLSEGSRVPRSCQSWSTQICFWILMILHIKDFNCKDAENE